MMDATYTHLPVDYRSAVYLMMMERNYFEDK
jgi:hypothetical protein